MSVVEAEVEVDAPPDKVWRVVADPRNLPKWDRHVISVSGVPDSGLAPGTEYLTEMRFLGARAKVKARVLELKAPEYSKIHLDGIVDATVETYVRPLPGNRTKLRHRVSYRFRGGPLGSVAASAVRMLGATTLLRNGVRAQKRQAEAS